MHVASNPAECAIPGTMADVAPDEGEHEDSFSGPVTERTGVDNVVLDAPPADEDSSAASNAPRRPAGGPVFTELLHPRVMAGYAWDRANWSAPTMPSSCPAGPFTRNLYPVGAASQPGALPAPWGC